MIFTKYHKLVRHFSAPNQNSPISSFASLPSKTKKASQLYLKSKLVWSNLWYMMVSGGWNMIQGQNIRWNKDTTEKTLHHFQWIKFLSWYNLNLNIQTLSTYILVLKKMRYSLFLKFILWHLWLEIWTQLCGFLLTVGLFITLLRASSHFLWIIFLSWNNLKYFFVWNSCNDFTFSLLKRQNVIF